MDFTYHLPVNIIFGGDSVKKLASIIEQNGCKRGLLVCDPFLKKSGVADAILACTGGHVQDVFSDLVPNPTVDNVNQCRDALRKAGADFAIALGGGSTIDCAKAACATARSDSGIEEYHTGGKPLDKADGIPLIAVPTTSGTGSEVTKVAVLTDTKKGLKAPLGNPLLFPKYAIIDHKLTMSVPPAVTASTGLDALCHAVEGYWSVNHQPICDSAAFQASKLVFDYLPAAYKDGGDEYAREMMSLASLMAGIAFSHPATTGSHACSFPLTNVYHIPHGEACIFTLDSFMRINMQSEAARINALASYCGFADGYEMAERIKQMKASMGMRTTLTAMGIAKSDIPDLAKRSMHPNMLNNPVSMTVEAVQKMYEELS